MTTPFRWDLARREQLGRLLTESDESNRWWQADEFQLCCARILAYAGDRRIIFVGRSLESVFDYLSGALSGTSSADRLSLFLFSMRWETVVTPSATAAIREYMRALKIDPGSIARSPVAFADLVFWGETFSNLVDLLKDWCIDDGTDWQAVRRNIRIIGVTQRTKTSPKTFRWHQHREVPMPASAVKNVSLDLGMWNYLGEHQPKVTDSYHPRRWGDEDFSHPDHDKEQLKAIQEAWRIFQDGRTREARRRLARMMTKTSGMQQEWFRHLVTEIKA
ncbi:MAG: hypothetical protein FWD63_08090 [Propionibacteriaceae bacterium]|nr:hypothetical protein [Propionibacteriaceae bacterium]